MQMNFVKIVVYLSFVYVWPNRTLHAIINPSHKYLIVYLVTCH